jgi:hypothetical protein
MERCECYEERTKIIGWLGPDEVIRKTVCVCNGTKEQDVCSCGGDRAKCDFYPQVRNKALKENEPMKAKLLINGKELEVEITEEELKKIEEKSAKKTGYERVEDGKCFWFDVDSVVHPDNDVYGDEERERSYEVANYYSNFEVATNNARADKLMRQLRRFSVEHREKELNWLDGEQKKYTISYDYSDNTFAVDHWYTSSEFGTMYFDSEETAELAIETFRDELLWYFTEYEDSL